MTNNSPFTKEHWLKKGFNEEEAIFHSKACRPIMKEYWLKRGFSESDAVNNALEKKNSNNKAGAKAAASRSKEEQRISSQRCVEYWIARGYSKEEGILEISKIQALGSLENFKKRYGEEEGIVRWKDRQIKWQNTLQNKTDYKEICERRNSLVIKDGEDIKNAIVRLNNTRNMNLVETISEYKEKLQADMINKPYLKYYPIDKYISSIPKIQIKILGITKKDIKKEILHLFHNNLDFLVIKGNKQAYRRWVSEGLLRSSYEIYFYEKIKKKDIEVFIDGCYPDSSMRYDFKIGNIYIEISPMLNIDEKYTQKMMKKQKVFGCVLLSSILEIDEFIGKI